MTGFSSLKRLLSALLLCFAVACSGPDDPITPDPGPDPVVPVNPDPGDDTTPDPPVVEESFTPAAGTTIYGTVTCGGEGVAGVVVSDGYQVVATDDKGRYELKSEKTLGYVFISMPGGYEVPSKGVQPLFYASCTKAADEAERADFTLTAVDQSDFSVLFFGDMHLAGRSFCHDVTQFREFADDVNDYISTHKGRKVYAVTLGDMSWDYYWETNRYDLTSYLMEINKDLPGLQVFHTMGNHDNDSSQKGDFSGAAAFRKVLGPNYYSFNIGGAHFIVLDNIEYFNDKDRNFYKEVSPEQIAWMKKDIARVSRNTPIFVTMHAPLYTSSGGSATYNLWDLISNFSGYDRIQFVTGHTHIIYNVDNLHRSVHVYENNSGAVCGAWWMPGYIQEGLHMGGDGAPGGYRVMEFSGKDFSWYFKGTGHPADYQFRTYDRNEIMLSADKWVPRASAQAKKEWLESVGDYAKKSSGNLVYINVWDYDPSWTISVKEKGKSLAVTQFTAKDPLYLAVYEAEEHNLGYSISYPGGTTDHLFKVQASAPDTPLEITVTDRFGRTYTETMTRPKPFSFDIYR